MNRELMRLLTYLRVSTILDRYLEYLAAPDVHEADKLQVALHLPLLKENWNVGRRIQLVEFLDAAQRSTAEAAGPATSPAPAATLPSPCRTRS